MHVAAGRVVDRPHAFVALVGDRVERPQQLAVGGVERLDEAAHAVLAAVGADQHLAVDDRGRHRFRIALLRIGDLRFPQQLAGLGVERDELGVDRAHEQLAALDRDAAVVVAAADGDDRPQLVLVVPELLARRRVDRVDVVERRRQEHDAVDDDRRGFHRLEHRGLEHERGLQLADVAGVDLRCRGSSASGRSCRSEWIQFFASPPAPSSIACVHVRGSSAIGLGRRRRAARQLPARAPMPARQRERRGDGRCPPDCF